MKTRIRTGLLGLGAAVVVLFFFDTVIFNIIVAILSIISVSEMFHAVFNKQEKSILFMIIAYIPAAVFPFGHWLWPYKIMPFVLYVYFILNLLYLIKTFQKTKFSSLGLYMIMTLLICFGLSCMVYLKDRSHQDALFYLLFALLCAWGSDVGAYFGGYFFGKHKLAPQISPKKTVEGLVSGIVFNMVLCFAVAFIYKNLVLKDTIDVAYVLLIVYSIIGALVGVLGDLTASVVKRQNDIKDFGDILPGHGGIVDRFDSVYFTMPVIYFLTILSPLIIR